MVWVDPVHERLWADELGRVGADEVRGSAGLALLGVEVLEDAVTLRALGEELGDEPEPLLDGFAGGGLDSDPGGPVGVVQGPDLGLADAVGV